MSDRLFRRDGFCPGTSPLENHLGITNEEKGKVGSRSGHEHGCLVSKGIAILHRIMSTDVPNQRRCYGYHEDDRDSILGLWRLYL